MKTVLFCLSMFYAVLVFAEDQSTEKKLKTWQTAVLVEGMIIANAGLATLGPKEYGWVATAVSPLVLTNEDSALTNTVGFLGFAGIGQYNVHELSEDKYSKSDVFKRNMYAFHAVGALVIFTEWLTGSEVKSENVAVLPTKDGVVMALNYQF